MAFWLDRFRREDEEDIWEELKQMLKNSDKYEAERSFKKPESWKLLIKLGTRLME